ncbi:MAG: hypothetical protein J6U14_02405 [Bacteroidaceae bacterium]|nr:hypothetical protein [Bacteroidaceae bacterium]
MKFINEEDLTEENMAEFWKEIDILEEEAERESKKLQESTHPKFNSIEEARRFYNAIPFSEWENKMFKKYGING